MYIYIYNPHIPRWISYLNGLPARAARPQPHAEP